MGLMVAELRHLFGLPKGAGLEIPFAHPKVAETGFVLEEVEESQVSWSAEFVVDLTLVTEGWGLEVVDSLNRMAKFEQFAVAVVVGQKGPDTSERESERLSSTIQRRRSLFGPFPVSP